MISSSRRSLSNPIRSAVSRDPGDLLAGFGGPGRPVDADDPSPPLLAGEPGDHPGLRAAGYGAHDYGVEEDAEFPLLLLDLYGPVGESQAAESVIRGARRDRVGLLAGGLDVRQSPLPALLEADAEVRFHQAHVGAHDPAELDVADPIVDHVGPVHPALLHEDTFHACPGGSGGDLAGVVGLHPAYGDERVATLGEGVGAEVLELAGLIAPVGEAGVAVVALGPERRPAQMRGQPLEAVHGRGAE